MKIMIIGICGYIGHNLAQYLLSKGHEVQGVDNMTTGQAITEGVEIHEATFPYFPSVQAIEQFAPDSIIHLSAFTSPDESMRNPYPYLNQNPHQTTMLCELVKAIGTKSVVFTSTANVYAQSDAPHKENEPLDPQTPYGAGKMASEQILRWYSFLYGFRAVTLRPFNVVGGYHQSYTHMIPNMLRAKELGSPFYLYGSDYKTPDGSCVRDLIHINDVCSAIDLAMSLPSGEYNLCSSTRTSVIDLAEAIGVEYEYAPRRDGDPPILIGDNSKLSSYGWQPKTTELQEIIESCLNPEI